MPDDEEKLADDAAVEAEVGPEVESVSFRSRMIGVVVLVGVFGLLYLLAKAMPMAGDFASEKLDGMVPDEVVAEEEVVIAPKEVKVAAKDEMADLKTQIVQCFDDPAMVEVVAVRISDDEEELLAMVKMVPDTKAVDIILKRDKFGRYVSEEGAEVEMKILPPGE